MLSHLCSLPCVHYELGSVVALGKTTATQAARSAKPVSVREICINSHVLFLVLSHLVCVTTIVPMHALSPAACFHNNGFANPTPHAGVPSLSAQRTRADLMVQWLLLTD